jgi:hypothetical protein
MSLDLPEGVRIKRIPGFPDYSVTTAGEIFSFKRKVPLRLKPRVSKSTGYPGVSLCRNGKAHTVNVHTAVAIAFLGPRPEGQVVRHLDGDSENCDVSNLAYGSHIENEADKERHGRRPKGDAIYGSKLTASEVFDMREMYADGEWIGNIRRKYPLHPTTIHHIIHGKIWSHLPLPDYSRRPDKVYPPSFRPRHKLSISQVKQIKLRLSDGESQYAIADSFGVSRSAIGHIARGATWSAL